MTSTEAGGKPVAVPELHLGDTIHLTPHDVYRHSDRPFHVTCMDGDVKVDWVLYRESIVVLVIWHDPSCPAVCGSTAYDADDSVLRVAVAA